MTNLGDARVTFSADVSQVEKEVQKLGGTIGTALEKAFERANAIAAEYTATIEQVGQATRDTFLDIQTMIDQSRPLQLVEGEQLEALRALSSEDPVGFLVRSGFSAAEAMQFLTDVISDAEKEVRRLEQAAQASERLQFVSPAFAQRAEVARNAAFELREELAELGLQGVKLRDELDRAIEAPAVEVAPEGQLFDAEKFESETSRMLDLMNQFGVSAQKSTTIASDGVEQLSFNFEEARAKAEQLAIAAAQVGKDNSLGPARAEATALAQQFSNLSRELALLTKAQKGGVINPALPSAIKQVRQELARLGLTAKDTEKILGRLGEQTEKKGIGRIFQGISDAFDTASEKIEEFTGFSEREIAVLLGAGLATGLAGIIRITEQFARAVGEFLANAQRLANDTERTFGRATSNIEGFATGTARQLGISSAEAIVTANAFAALGKQMKLSENATLDFSKAMTLATGAIERSVPGLHSTEEAQQLLEEAVGGSEEALRKLEVSMSDLNAAAHDLFGSTFFGQLSQAEQEIARTSAVLRAAEEAMANAGRAGSTLGDAVRSAGRALGDIFTKDQQERFDRAVAGLEKLQEFPEANVAALGSFATNLKGLGRDQLLFLKTQIDTFDITNKQKKEAKRLIDEEIAAIEKQVGLIREAREEYEKSADAQKINLENLRNNVEVQRQIADMERTISRAREDGARQVAEAELRLARTREDNARKFQDLNIRNRRSFEDAARQIQDAELEVQETIQDRTAQVEDAIDQLTDAREDARRSVRDINERIEDLELDHARKVEDLQLRKVRAHQKAKRDIIETLVDIQIAQIRGDVLAFNAAQRALNAKEDEANQENELADLKRDRAREEEDFDRERKRLARDLKEARLDGIKEIERAERDLHRAEVEMNREIFQAQLQLNDAIRDQQRAYEDAQRALQLLEVEQNRALRDAKKGFEDAERARDRAIEDAIRAFERFARSLGFTIEEVREELLKLGVHQIVQRGPMKFLHGGGTFAPFEPFVANEGAGGRNGELIITKSGGVVISHREFMRLLEALEGHGGTGGTTGVPPVTVIHNGYSPEATALRIAALLAQRVNN